MVKTTILIAEDYPDLLNLLRYLFEKEGFNVLTAKDGARALELLSQSHPDVILTDLAMPYVDGLELIRRVKKNAELTDTPIIAMTAYSDSFISEAVKLGATTTLRKPEDLDRVLETVSQVIATARHSGSKPASGAQKNGRRADRKLPFARPVPSYS